jgi:hypothetical protein
MCTEHFAGDIYCLASPEVSSSLPLKAHPILLGIPHDSDPHFSPTGDLLAFRSDAGLGVENIWVRPWRGCAESSIRPDTEGESKMSDEVKEALNWKELDEELMDGGSRETEERRTRRLIREGRAEGTIIYHSSFASISLTGSSITLPLLQLTE